VKLTASNGCRQLSAAQRETAAERLRLATELRELKEAHTKMRTQFNKLKHDKAAQDETLAATVVELEGVRESNAALHAQVHEQHIQIRALTQERDELRKELKAQIKLAKARATQIEELAAAMDASNGRWQKEYDILRSPGGGGSAGLRRHALDCRVGERRRGREVATENQDRD